MKSTTSTKAFILETIGSLGWSTRGALNTCPSVYLVIKDGKIHVVYLGPRLKRITVMIFEYMYFPFEIGLLLI